MKDVSDKLENGHNLIIFPEGTRGEPGELQSFKSGIGRIAEKYRHIPIVPVLYLVQKNRFQNEIQYLFPYGII